MVTEKRLISLDEALDATHNEVFWTESEAAAVRSFLVKRPRVDAVEVVRCHACEDHGRCEIEDLLVHSCGIENPYCAGGARKQAWILRRKN